MKKQTGDRPYPRSEAKDALVEPDTRRVTETFIKIVQKHQKAVFAMAYARVGNAHDAEDVKQEVFIEVWRNMHKLGIPEKVPAWLYKVTTNRCKDHFRKNFRRKRRETAYAETTTTNPSNPSPEDSEILDAMFQAISLLPEGIRTVVMLKHFAKVSYAEISQMTGLSKTTIDGRLRAGKRNLRKRLSDMGVGVD